MTGEEKRVPVKVSRTPGEEDSRAGASGDVDGADESLENELGRLESAAAAGPGLATKHRPSYVAEMWRVYTDLFDTGEEYRVLIEVPAIQKEGLNVTVSTKEIRVLVGGRSGIPADAGYGQARRTDSKILRTVVLPEEVMAARAEANLNNGVLEVKVPKRSPTDGSKHWTLIR